MKWICMSLIGIVIGGCHSASESQMFSDDSAAECAPTRTVTFGQFFAATEINDDSYGPPSQDLAGKISEQLSGATVNLNLRYATQHSSATTCSYSNGRRHLLLEITKNSRGTKINLIRQFSTAGNSRLAITTNFVELLDHEVLNTTQELRLTEPMDVSFENAEYRHRSDWFYSCGFTDCTFDGGTDNLLGASENIAIH